MKTILNILLILIAICSIASSLSESYPTELKSISFAIAVTCIGAVFTNKSVNIYCLE